MYINQLHFLLEIILFDVRISDTERFESTFQARFKSRICNTKVQCISTETLEETIESGPLCITELFQNKISL